VILLGPAVLRGRESGGVGEGERGLVEVAGELPRRAEVRRRAEVVGEAPRGRPQHRDRVGRPTEAQQCGPEVGGLVGRERAVELLEFARGGEEVGAERRGERVGGALDRGGAEGAVVGEEPGPAARQRRRVDGGVVHAAARRGGEEGDGEREEEAHGFDHL
jgi:hypothetical protein